MEMVEKKAQLWLTGRQSDVEAPIAEIIRQL
jgi:hypothetical protein